MRIVANAASNTPRMLPGDNLRESLWFRAIRLMADHAEFGRVGQNRLLAGEVRRMLAERPMAGFTSDIDVRALTFGGDDIVVARSACGAARKYWSPGSDFIQRAGAIVPVFAEVPGHEGLADRQKCEYEGRRDQCEPDQVLRAFEYLPHALCHKASAPPFAARGVGRTLSAAKRCLRKGFGGVLSFIAMSISLRPFAMFCVKLRRFADCKGGKA
jgi:hypothetical protein